MINILLIDDKANQGWKQLLEKVFPIQGIKIDIAIDFETAIDKIKTSWSLIFLDVRLNKKDYENYKVEEFSGFKILKEIKKDFLNVNYSTPIILLTASNKIWNIDAFKNYGVDAYYIKEHPDNVFDKEASRQNYKNFKDNFDELLNIRNQRELIWRFSKEIIELVNSHKYFFDSSGNKNVKDRIVDKIKLGYYYLFKEPSALEKYILKADNESISFLIYFSILEEISKAYSQKNTWNKTGEFSGNWKFRNKKSFIERDDCKIVVDPYFDKEQNRYVVKKLDLIDHKYSAGQINLSEQIYALIYHFNIHHKFKEIFEKSNRIRNKLNYTHSSVQAIFNASLKDSSLTSDFRSGSNNMLLLIIEILKHPKD